MTERIWTLDDWTELRHRVLTEADQYVWNPGHTVAAKGTYTRDNQPVTAPVSRTLTALRASGLIRHVVAGHSTYDSKPVTRTSDQGDELLKRWTHRYGHAVEPVLSEEALKHAAAYAELLEWHGARHRGPFGSGVSHAATIIRNAAGTDPWADDDTNRK